VPALTTALRDEDASVREAAAKALGNIGPAAKAAIPGLVELARDDDALVRRTAAGVLSGMGPAAAPGLAELLLDGNADIRRTASQALRYLELEAETEDSPSQTEINR
jgi:HEAT repeat protein